VQGMNKQMRFLKGVLSVHKYPRYLADIYVEVRLLPVWRPRGLRLGSGISWYGLPIVSLAQGTVISIGDGCAICSRSSQTALGVNHPVVLRTLRPEAELRIGAGVRMSGTTICAAKRVTIGDRCVIGANVTIVDTDFHSLDAVTRSSPEDASVALAKEVVIGDDVFIGVGSYILKGVSIGAHAVIGAASVVTKDVPADTNVAGNPARPVGATPARIENVLS